MLHGARLHVSLLEPRAQDACRHGKELRDVVNTLIERIGRFNLWTDDRQVLEPLFRHFKVARRINQVDGNTYADELEQPDNPRPHELHQARVPQIQIEHEQVIIENYHRQSQERALHDAAQDLIVAVNAFQHAREGNAVDDHQCEIVAKHASDDTVPVVPFQSGRIMSVKQVD